MKKILTLFFITTLFIVSCEDNQMDYSHADYLKMMTVISQDEMVGLDAMGETDCRMKIIVRRYMIWTLLHPELIHFLLMVLLNSDLEEK